MTSERRLKGTDEVTRPGGVVAVPLERRLFAGPVVDKMPHHRIVDVVARYRRELFGVSPPLPLATG